MKIIQIKENQKEDWNKFIAENNSEGFLQAWEWGEFQKSLERKIFRIGVVEDNLCSKFIAVALIVKYNLPLGRSYLYCPRGPMITHNSKLITHNLLKKFFDYLKNLGREEKAIFLRFDPAVEINNCRITKGSTALRRLWSQHNFKKSPAEIQPRNTLILDLTKSEEELLKEMKQKTRYNIRLAGKKELRIKNYELGIKNKEKFKKYFEEFWKLVEETSERDKFKSHRKNYYWRMMESVSCLNYFNLQARLYLSEYKNKIIAANIILYFGNYCVYLHGASSSKHRNVMAPYLLQWQQILDAKKIGCKSYDFWGVVRQAHHDKSNVILSLSKDNKNSWDGITRFKKGFGGCEKKYIGAYDLVFSNIGYAIYKFVKFIKSKVCKVTKLF